MGAIFTRRVQAALLSLVILGSVCGCARAPRNPASRPNPTGAAVGGGAPGNVATPNAAGRTAIGTGAARADWGQQISDSVARLVGGRTAGTGYMGLGRTNGGAGTTDGDAAGRRTATGVAGTVQPVGVSTLTIGNLAFVGLDLSTVPNGGATTGAANQTGGVALESRIRSYILGAYPQVDEVYVTTDPALVRRIAQVTGEVQNGASTAARLSEIFSIANALVGTTRDTNPANIR